MAAIALSTTAIAPENSSNIGTALVNQDNPLSSLSVNSSIEEIKRAIVYEATKNGINPFMMLDLSDCENDYRNSCIVDTNKRLSCGQFMFQEETFKWFCPDLEWRVENMIFMNPADNIRCAVRAAKDVNTIRQHWVICSLKLKI